MAMVMKKAKFENDMKYLFPTVKVYSKCKANVLEYAKVLSFKKYFLVLLHHILFVEQSV